MLLGIPKRYRYWEDSKMLSFIAASGELMLSSILRTCGLPAGESASWDADVSKEPGYSVSDPAPLLVCQGRQ